MHGGEYKETRSGRRCLGHVRHNKPVTSSPGTRETRDVRFDVSQERR